RSSSSCATPRRRRRRPRSARTRGCGPRAWRPWVSSRRRRGAAPGNPLVKISAKADYAVRAAAELAAAGDGRVKGEALATAQGIPQNFLENILTDLRHAGLVKSQRGADGGYRLARPAAEVTVADVIRAVDGPLAAVRGEAPEDVTYVGA